jgi:hypothetical protein
LGTRINTKVLYIEETKLSNALYAKGREAFLTGGINWASDTIKVALVTSGYTPALTTHQFYSDLTPASNVVGTDQTLTSKTTTNGTADAADVTFSAVASGAIKYVAIYKSTGTNSTSPLIALIDTATGLPVTANGGDISVTWSSGNDRIFTL